jgi:hypothetical protein
MSPTFQASLRDTHNLARNPALKDGAKFSRRSRGEKLADAGSVDNFWPLSAVSFQNFSRTRK